MTAAGVDVKFSVLVHSAIRYTTLLFICSLLLPLLCIVILRAVSRGSPSLRASWEQTFDFGRVAHGSRTKHVFQISNSSRLAPMQINTIRAGCNCLTVYCDNYVIGPGGHAKVTVETDTTSMIGFQRRMCVVTFSDQTLRPMPLYVEMVVYDPAAFLSSSQIAFGDVVRGSRVRQNIRVLNAFSWRIHRVTTSSPNIICRIISPTEVACSVGPNVQFGPIDESRDSLTGEGLAAVWRKYM